MLEGSFLTFSLCFSPPLPAGAKRAFRAIPRIPKDVLHSGVLAAGSLLFWRCGAPVYLAAVLEYVVAAVLEYVVAGPPTPPGLVFTKFAPKGTNRRGLENVVESVLFSAKQLL